MAKFNEVPKDVYLKISSELQTENFLLLFEIISRVVCAKNGKHTLKKEKTGILFIKFFKGNRNAFVGEFSALGFGLKATTGFPPSLQKSLFEGLANRFKKKGKWLRPSPFAFKTRRTHAQNGEEE